MTEPLKGKKTILGGILLSLLSLAFGLDCLINGGSPAWMSVETYAAIGSFIGGLTQVSLKLAIKKTEV